MDLLRTDDHIARVRREEQVISEIQQAQTNLRPTGRRLVLGVDGGRDVAPLREAVAAPGVGWYPLAALGLLAAAATFPRFGWLFYSNDIGPARGFSAGQITLISTFTPIAIAIGMFFFVAIAKSRRAWTAIGAGFALAALLLLGGFLTGGLWVFFLLFLIMGLATASAFALHLPLLMDVYPAGVRLRVFFAYQAFVVAGGLAVTLLSAGLTVEADATWRLAFLSMGALALVAALAAARFREPVLGRHDSLPIREVVDTATGYPGTDREEEEVRLRLFEGVRRVALRATVRELLPAFVILGAMGFPLYTILADLLEARWRLGFGSRGLCLVALMGFQIAALAVSARRAEAILRAGPDKLLVVGGRTLLVGGLALGFAPFVPPLWGALILFGIAFAAAALLLPILSVTLLSIVPPALRSHASALAGVMLMGFGGLAGLALFLPIETKFGLKVAIACLAPLVMLAAVKVMRQAPKVVVADVDWTVDEIVETEYVRSLKGQGIHLPLLACQGINFSYGQLQVLFDVTFTVDEGEMVALLGTNGAGKSTLLSVVSGLNLPRSGSVRFDGRGITHVDAERRVGLGITQIPGGRAVFGPMTVVENLRSFAYSLGRSRSAIEQAIDDSFDAFPALADRRNQQASTLSGGQQQMLGLCRALILKPRLLLIDELSLGLAPKVTAGLVEMVRRINATGTAVVLVEQSVNVALLLVQHAYFMEKGEIRFDGPAPELLERTDLLRSVFLEGAAKGLNRV